MSTNLKVLLALVLISTVGIAGCTSTAGRVITAPAPNGAAAAPTGQRATLGQTITLKDSAPAHVVAVTVVKVVDPDRGSDEFSVAKAGTRYVSVQVRIVNKGTNTYSDDPQVATKVADAAGQNYNITFVTATKAGPQMDSGLNLAPGDTALGFLTFEIPAGAKIAKVQYGLSIGFGQVGQWSIG